jgi:hypothetical protein
MILRLAANSHTVELCDKTAARDREDQHYFESSGSAKVDICALIGRTDRKMAADRAHPTTDRTMNS